MKAILAAVKNGSLKFLMTAATQSNSGASAYLAMLSSALGNKPVIEPGDLDKPDVQGTVRALLGGVERSSGSSGWLADLYTESAGKGVLYDAMWNYEAILKETNDKLAGMGKEPLYAIYPADGVVVADSPIGFVDHGRGQEVETFFNQLVDYLRSAPVQKRIADTGRRIPLSDIAAKPDPVWNFDPTRIVTASGKQQRQARCALSAPDCLLRASADRHRRRGRPPDRGSHQSAVAGARLDQARFPWAARHRDRRCRQRDRRSAARRNRCRIADAGCQCHAGAAR